MEHSILYRLVALCGYGYDHGYGYGSVQVSRSIMTCKHTWQPLSVNSKVAFMSSNRHTDRDSRRVDSWCLADKVWQRGKVGLGLGLGIEEGLGLGLGIGFTVKLGSGQA